MENHNSVKSEGEYIECMANGNIDELLRLFVTVSQVYYLTNRLDVKKFALLRSKDVYNRLLEKGALLKFRSFEDGLLAVREILIKTKQLKK